jgi:hypothetical protein
MVVYPMNSSTPLPPPTGSSKLADAVTSWAVRWEVNDNPYVRGIGDALATGDDLPAWSAIDPWTALPHAEPANGTNWTRISRVFVILRNILVFVPVALTWFAISEASRAFGNFVDAKGDGQYNFLYFWQNGGPGYLDRAFQLPRIALIDFFIITVIVGLTLFAAMLNARGARQRSKYERMADEERDAIALKLAVAGHWEASASPESIAEAVAVALSELLQATHQVGDAADRLAATSTAMTTLTGPINSLTQEVSKFTTTGAGPLAQSFTGLAAAVGSLQHAVTDDTANVLSEIVVGLEVVNENLRRTAATVEFGTKQLRDDLDVLHHGLAASGRSR